MTTSFVRVLGAAALSQLVFLGPVAADGLQITPGLWRITSTTTNMMGPPKTETEDQCMQDETFDPIAELQDDSQTCTITSQDLTDNTLTFEMSCAGAGGPPATGSGRYTINGNSGDGEMTYSMSFGGQNMTMTNSWTAERIGDC